MNKLELLDARLHVEQAQAVLGFWLEATAIEAEEKTMICALMSLLEGVPDAMKEADESLYDHEERQRKGIKS
ncbi:hypothetical protein [Pectobacterium polaris]|uniref:hypothetical protein n=1 Tax=Pectobacterium polaris TaxID=2042057 RepID=UPI000F8E3FB3|nr:hypothetical protein [Pectobacterium polaris]RUR91061.1 hypothetical protein KHDHEBDM_03924 [Pectobacterium polaris]